MKLLLSSVGVLSALAFVQPAAADEAPSAPRRARPAVERAAPAPQQPQAKWSGGQVGGSNGVSSVNNNFVDPGAFVCPVSPSSGGSTFGRSCFETPFQFSGHKASYTIGPFVGYRLQFGGWVVGIEGDWSWKNSESSLSQSSSTAISAGTTTTSFFDSFSGTIISSTVPNNYFRTDSFAGSVKQKSDSSIRARVGWLVTPWSLLYVTGGRSEERRVGKGM